VRYERLIATALSDLRDDPLRATSVDRSELRAGARTYHLICCRRRAAGPEGAVARPRHLLIYEITSHDRVTVLRMAHDAVDMDRLFPDPDPSSG
jgi:plasmid stabilization system protein ParE